MHESEKWKWRCSVVSNSLRPHGLQPTRLLHPWDFPGKSTGVGCHCLLLLYLEEINYEDLHTSMKTDCPRSAGGRLETQGSRWQRPSSDTWENWWWKLQSESEADWCPCSKTVRQRDGILSYSAFHSVQTLNRMDEVHPHWWGLFALFSKLIHMLIPPRNTLPDTLRIMFNWIFGQMFNWISGYSMA